MKTAIAIIIACLAMATPAHCKTKHKGGKNSREPAAVTTPQPSASNSAQQPQAPNQGFLLLVSASVLLVVCAGVFVAKTISLRKSKSPTHTGKLETADESERDAHRSAREEKTPAQCDSTGQIYIHQNDQQLGPFSEEQIRSMVASGQISETENGWHEGLSEWQPLNAILALAAPVAAPALTAAPLNEHKERVVQTNVKQGAIIGGWVCFALGTGLMTFSMWSFFIYGPLFLVAFILSIVAMSQRRVLGGIALLLCALLVPTALGLVLFSTRTSKFLNDVAANSSPLASREEESEDAVSESPTENSIAKSMEKAQRESDLKELEELRARKVQFEKNLLALKGFKVLRANFSKKTNSIGMRESVIELTIENGTGKAVKRAYFHGVLSSAGRAVPWIDETFNYEVAGGVEPHEKAAWHLAPNMFGPWGKVDVPEDAQFDVTVIRLDGPDGEKLFGDADFRERDEKRLGSLENKYKGEPPVPLEK